MPPGRASGAWFPAGTAPCGCAARDRCSPRTSWTGSGCRSDARACPSLRRCDAAHHDVDVTLVVVRDPQQPVVARLKDLQTQYPGSEIKITACERPT